LWTTKVASTSWPLATVPASLVSGEISILGDAVDLAAAAGLAATGAGLGAGGFCASRAVTTNRPAAARQANLPN
jgi:hypothetical protein